LFNEPGNSFKAILQSFKAISDSFKAISESFNEQLNPLSLKATNNIAQGETLRASQNKIPMLKASNIQREMFDAFSIGIINYRVRRVSFASLISPYAIFLFAFSD